MTIEERIESIEKAERHFQTNWMAQIERGLENIEKRLAVLEGGFGRSALNQKSIGLAIEWPEADIGGLRFNARKTRGVFDLKEDGNYHSRDILFNSARDTDDGTGRDLLSEYLESEAVKEAFTAALEDFAQPGTIRVFLPEENQGVKKYNGASWWYWLRARSSGSAASFAYSSTNGYAYLNNASSVGGCAPAFCVANGRGADVS